jgi:hypothetical protein
MLLQTISFHFSNNDRDRVPDLEFQIVLPEWTISIDDATVGRVRQCGLFRT